MNTLAAQFVESYRTELRQRLVNDPMYRGWKDKSDAAIALFVLHTMGEINGVIPKRENLFKNKPALEAASKNVGINTSSKLRDLVCSLTPEDWKELRVGAGITGIKLYVSIHEQHTTIIQRTSPFRRCIAAQCFTGSDCSVGSEPQGASFPHGGTEGWGAQVPPCHTSQSGIA